MSKEASNSEKTMKNFMFFFSGQLFSMLGSSIVSFTIIWWLTVTYSNPLYLSVAYFLTIGIQIIMSPIAGVFVDRWDRKKVIFFTDLLVVFGSITYIFLFTYESLFDGLIFVRVIFLVIIFNSIVSSFQSPTVFSTIPLMVPKDKLVRFNGLRYILYGSINIIGPGIGALLYELWPLNAIIALDGGTFLISLIPLISLKIPKVEKDKKTQQEKPKNNRFRRFQFLDEFKEGFRFIFSIKGLFTMYFIGTLINFFEIPLLSLRPIFISEFHGGTATALALVVGLGQMGMLFSGIFLMFYKKHWKNKTVVRMIALYVQIAGCLIQSLTLTGQFWMMGVGSFIMGMTFPFTSSMNSTIMHIVVPPQKQARVSTLLNTIGMILTPIGTLIAGVLVSIVGYVPLFVGSILVGTISITIIWFITNIRSIDKLVQKIELEEAMLKEANVTIS